MVAVALPTRERSARPGRDAERELIRAAQQGDRRARARLLAAHRSFVFSRVYKRVGLGRSEIDDLLQEGLLGLNEAIDHFDTVQTKAGLITYAVYWIDVRINNCSLREASLVRLGTTQTQREMFFSKNQLREGNLEHAEFLQRLSPMASFDTAGESGLDLHGRVADTRALPEALLIAAEENARARGRLNKILRVLWKSERTVFELRYLSRDRVLTLREVAERMGFSRERARQLEMRGLQRLIDTLELKMTARELGESMRTWLGGVKPMQRGRGSTCPK